MNPNKRRNVAMFVWPVRVYYEDTDSGGVVYYANYLKFMERSRTEWLRSLGVEQDRLIAQDQLLFAVHSVAVDYVQPARFNDLLWVTAAVQECGRASLTFNQHIVRADPERRNGPSVGRVDKDEYAALVNDRGTLLSKGQVRIACLDSETMRPRAIPSHLYTEISRVD